MYGQNQLHLLSPAETHVSSMVALSKKKDFVLRFFECRVSDWHGETETFMTPYTNNTKPKTKNITPSAPELYWEVRATSTLISLCTYHSVIHWVAVLRRLCTWTLGTGTK